MSLDDRTSRALDRALELTFPASDPIAVYIAEERDVSSGNADARGGDDDTKLK
jgi:hypothetical protein